MIRRLAAIALSVVAVTFAGLSAGVVVTAAVVGLVAALWFRCIVDSPWVRRIIGAVFFAGTLNALGTQIGVGVTAAVVAGIAALVVWPRGAAVA